MWQQNYKFFLDLSASSALSASEKCDFSFVIPVLSSAQPVFPFLPVLPYLSVHQPDEQHAEDGEDEQDDARIEVVALHAAPHFEYQLGAVAEVAYHGTTLHYLSVWILYGVYLKAVRSGQGTEEVAQVRIGVEGGIALRLHDFGGDRKSVV